MSNGNSTANDEHEDQQEVFFAKLIVTAPILGLIWVLLRRGCK